MNLSGLHFANFWPLLLLFGIPLIALFYLLRIQALAKAHKTLGVKPGEGSSYALFKRAFFYTLSWLFLVVALMNPLGNPHYERQVVESGALEVQFLIDTSASMSALDGGASNSRLISALQIADDQAENFSGRRVGITPFTSIAATLLPPSFDVTSVKIALREMSIDDTGVAGTDLVRVFNSLSENPPRHYVMISDGEDTLWQTTEDKKAREKEIEAALKKVAGRWTFIGVGGERPVKIPGMDVKTAQAKSLLTTLSESVNGEYIDSSQEKVEISSSSFQRSSVSYNSYFQIPLLIALLFLLLGKREGI